MKSKSKVGYQKQQHKKAIQMVEELLHKMKKGELITEEHGWWQAGQDGRFTFRVTVNTRETLN